ncbi:hypothetical protein [Tateyamaria sp. SN6-1]|uniref:hypothetical protein n=1 Tax=Tateyamaria sp. SN6-1 TaxID=3092148 RepID=UPI0039F4D1A5
MIDASEAAYWRATTMWRDVGELTQHTMPLPYATELIALGLENSAQEDERIARDGLMAQLCKTGVSDETAQMEARLLGFDITEELSTALFRSPRPERLRDVTIPRSAAGLIPDRDTAKSIRPHLEAADRGAPPLLIVSVWSLGEQVAT